MVTVWTMALLTAVADPGAGEEPLLVVLRVRARAAGPFVRLEEVADLWEGPERMRAHAAEILLGWTPDGGRERQISSWEIESRLRESGYPPSAFRVEGAPRVTVLRESFVEAAPEPAGVSPPRKSGAEEARPASRRASAPDRAGESGRARQPASARPGSPGTGRSDRRPQDQSAPAAVEKGSSVVIRLSGQALVIDEPGKALESGAPGQTIEVQNLRTGKKLPARVTSAGNVTALGALKDEGSAGDEGRGE